MIGYRCQVEEDKSPCLLEVEDRNDKNHEEDHPRHNGKEVLPNEGQEEEDPHVRDKPHPPRGWAEDRSQTEREEEGVRVVHEDLQNVPREGEEGAYREEACPTMPSV